MRLFNVLRIYRLLYWWNALMLVTIVVQSRIFDCSFRQNLCPVFFFFFNTSAILTALSYFTNASRQMKLNYQSKSALRSFIGIFTAVDCSSERRASHLLRQRTLQRVWISQVKSSHNILNRSSESFFTAYYVERCRKMNIKVDFCS